MAYHLLELGEGFFPTALEMGLIYWEEMSDPNRARDLYNEVAEGDHVVLAQRELAHNLLSVLPAP